ncbi:MAG: PAS domain S-box protein, partial [Planctomycetota bacterium]
MVRLYETWFRGEVNQRSIRGVVRSGSRIFAVAHFSWWCFVVVLTLMILSEVGAVDAPMLVSRCCCAAADGNAGWPVTSETAAVSAAKLFKYAFLPLIIVFTALVAGLCVLKRQAVIKTSQLEEEIAKRKRIVTTLTLRDRAITGATNGIIITEHTSTDNPIIYVNPAFEQITGFSADEVIGRDCRFLQGDDRNQSDLNKIRSAITEERDCRAVLRNYRKDGSMFWNELSISPVRDEKGKVTHFVGIISDITGRKSVEEAVMEAARFPNENPNPVLRISADGTIIYCNKASSELLNFWRCGQNEPLPEPHREFVREALSSGLTREVDVQCGCRTYSLFFTPIADVNYVNVYGLDITDRKRAENDLEKERNLLRTLIDNIPDHVFVKDTQGRFVSVNTAIAHVMGAKDEHELIGKTDFEYYPQEAAAEYYSDEQRIIESGRPIINKDEPHLDK